MSAPTKRHAHEEWAKAHPPRPGYSCGPHAETYGGGCFNCGFRGSISRRIARLKSMGAKTGKQRPDGETCRICDFDRVIDRTCAWCGDTP